MHVNAYISIRFEILGSGAESLGAKYLWPNFERIPFLQCPVTQRLMEREIRSHLYTMRIGVRIEMSGRNIESEYGQIGSCTTNDACTTKTTYAVHCLFTTLRNPPRARPVSPGGRRRATYLIGDIADLLQDQRQLVVGR